MADIFVSYSRQDRPRVAPLVAALEAQGWSVWWDPAITPGEEFDTLISRELEAARSLVVVWTPASVDSRWVRGEARDAADRGILAPVRFDGARMPIDFRAVHTTDLDDWAEDAAGQPFRDLCKALEGLLGKPAPAQAADGGKASAPAKAQISVCVLPFANMSGDPEQEYFSDGITEDVITDLSKVSALSVVSRATAFALKGSATGVAEIGRQTKASHVLVGSVRKAGQRVRITAQLVEAATDAQVWADRYDGGLEDIFALQDEISRAIVGALKLTLAPGEKKALEQRGTTNVKAYKFFLMARQFQVMGSQRHQEVVVRLCQRAVELDPNYAAAWASMSLSQMEIYRRQASDHDGTEAAERAIALDPNLADSHAALAYCRQHQGKWEEALAACAVALRLDPEHYEGNRVAGVASLAIRRFDDAIGYFERAAAAQPTEFAAAAFASQAYLAKGDQAAGVAAARRALERVEKVIAVEPDHGRALSYGAGLLATCGEEERAREWIERGALVDPDNVVQLFNFVCALVGLGDYDEALDLLESIIDKASRGWLVWLDSDTDLDPIRPLPRFDQIVAAAKARFDTQAA